VLTWTIKPDIVSIVELGPQALLTIVTQGMICFDCLYRFYRHLKGYTLYSDPFLSRFSLYSLVVGI